MSKFFKKIFKKPIDFNSINFMKHKLIFIIIPVITLLTLAGIFTYNFCSDKYYTDVFTERTKLIINIPINDNIEINSSILKNVQNFSTDYFGAKCNARFLKEYKDSTRQFSEEGLQKEIEISAHWHGDNLDDEERLDFYDSIREEFPKIITCSNPDIIYYFDTVDLQNTFDFWMQVIITSAIIVLISLISLGLTFKKYGFVSAIVVSIISLILSLGISFFAMALLTQTVNLTFIVAMSIYSAVNSSLLFHEIHAKLKENPEQKDLYAIANSAISKTIVPHTLIALSILVIMILSSYIFGFTFNNHLLFHLTTTTTVGIAVDLFLNIFCNGQLWAMLNKKLRKKLTPPKPISTPTPTQK